jgi:hypothetical protein
MTLTPIGNYIQIQPEGFIHSSGIILGKETVHKATVVAVSPDIPELPLLPGDTVHYFLSKQIDKPEGILIMIDHCLMYQKK